MKSHLKNYLKNVTRRIINLMCDSGDRGKKGDNMIKHYLTKYQENNKKFASSWIQVNLFGKVFCFSKKTIEI